MQVFSCEYCEIFKNSFLCRTPPVADSVVCISNVNLIEPGGESFV